MADQRHDVLIVGAGHGGAQAAIALRQRGFTGSIAVVGEEPEIPYERPPLSKEYLAGDKPFERLLIRPCRLLGGARRRDADGQARGRDRSAGAHRRRWRMETALGYGSLIWAAGGHARRLACSGHSLVGVHSVRSRADVDRMMGELARGQPGVRDRRRLYRA